MRVGTDSLSLAATPLREPVMTLAPSLARLLSLLISKPSFDNSSLVSLTMVAALHWCWQDILNGQEMDLWYTCLWVSKLYKGYQLLYHRDIGGFIHHQAVAVCVLYLLYYFIPAAKTVLVVNSEICDQNDVFRERLESHLVPICWQESMVQHWIFLSWISNSLWKYDTRLLCFLKSKSCLSQN